MQLLWGGAGDDFFSDCCVKKKKKENLTYMGFWLLFLLRLKTRPESIYPGSQTLSGCSSSNEEREVGHSFDVLA